MDGSYVSSEFPNFRINSDKVYPKFLELYFKQRWIWNEVKKKCTGTTKASRNRFKEKFFLDSEISLPPLNQQKDMVSRIERLMSQIEKASKIRKSAIEKIEQLFPQVLYEIFSDKRIMEETKRVEEICTKPQYGYTDSAKYEPVGPKFLRITDIQNGKVDWEQVPFCVCPEEEKYLLQPEDILFARSGATTGKSFLVEDPPVSVFASYLIRIRSNEGILPEYLYWFFQSPLYWSQVMEKTKGSAQPNMNGRKLSKVQVPLPDSQETQRSIVKYLNSLREKVDGLRELQYETLEEIDGLTPNILDKALKGVFIT